MTKKCKYLKANASGNTIFCKATKDDCPKRIEQLKCVIGQRCWNVAEAQR